MRLEMLIGMIGDAINGIESEGLLGHDVVEVLAGDLAAVGSSTLQHFLEFLDVHGLTELLGDAADVGGLDEASVVVVEEVEDLIDAVLRGEGCTLVSLSPSLEVMPSRNS
jgi:hypothetical protein